MFSTKITNLIQIIAIFVHRLKSKFKDRSFRVKSFPLFHKQEIACRHTSASLPTVVDKSADIYRQAC